jgi:hypothetical protein
MSLLDIWNAVIQFNLLWILVVGGGLAMILALLAAIKELDTRTKETGPGSSKVQSVEGT